MGLDFWDQAASGTGGSPEAPRVLIDAISLPSVAASAQSITLNMTVGEDANAMRIQAQFGYSQHAGFGLTWTVGEVVQTLTVTPNFSFIMTSDNGPAAPAIAVFGLLNPTPGAGTIRMAFESDPDNLVMQATTYKNVHLLGGVSGAFAAADFVTGTSNEVTIPLPAIPGGIQEVFACGVAGVPSADWNEGTTIYSESSGGDTWGASAYLDSDSATDFTLGISASEFWAAAALVVNVAYALPSGTISLDHSNSITSLLLVSVPCVGAVELTDLVTGHTSLPVGCSTDLTGGFNGGMNVPAGSANNGADFGNWQPIPDGDFGIVVVANPGLSTRGVLVGQADVAVLGFATLQANSTYLNAQANGTACGSVFATATSQGADDGNRQVTNGTYHVGVIDGNYHAFGFFVVGGVPSFWCDGALTTEESTPITVAYVNGQQHFKIGGLGDFTGSDLSADCTIVVAHVLGTTVPAVRASITAQPCQVLQ